MLSGGLAWSPIAAQEIGVVQSNILVLDAERMFTESRPGEAFLASYTAEREALIARNRALEADLRAQEQDLTDQRKTLTPEEFRDLADAFDEKVRRIREDSERASRDLERKREQAPFLLMRRAEGVLGDIMRDTGGVVILDARQVLVRAAAVDITDMAIARVNAAMAQQDGADAPEEQPETQPEPLPETLPDTLPEQ